VESAGDLTSSKEEHLAMKGFRPLQDRVPVRRVEAEEKTPGGIIIPDTAKENSIEAEVLATGRAHATRPEKSFRSTSKPTTACCSASVFSAMGRNGRDHRRRKTPDLEGSRHPRRHQEQSMGHRSVVNWLRGELKIASSFAHSFEAGDLAPLARATFSHVLRSQPCIFPRRVLPCACRISRCPALPPMRLRKFSPQQPSRTAPMLWLAGLQA
jgi:hypothetical protein